MTEPQLNRNDLTTLLKLVDQSIAKQRRADANRLARGKRTEGWDTDKALSRRLKLKRKLERLQELADDG